MAEAAFRGKAEDHWANSEIGLVPSPSVLGLSLSLLVLPLKDFFVHIIICGLVCNKLNILQLKYSEIQNLEANFRLLENSSLLEGVLFKTVT